MDSRTIKATLDALAASPRPVAEACFDQKSGKLVRVAFEPSTPAAQKPRAELEDRDQAPKVKPEKKRTAIASLKMLPPEWQIEPEASNG